MIPIHTQVSLEPMILIDDTSAIMEEEEQCDSGPAVEDRQQSLDVDSPDYNPYLLSPWKDPRETRKHSLPTPQCSGITASQVRRLSDRGGPSSKEVAFLATLSTAPGPSPGGRRHSVVTISKVPPAFFGRDRRESIAAFPTMSPTRVLGSRRESFAGAVGPPSTGERRGSSHNLQLDIMDDIVTARKVRLKCYNTSNEKVCEVEPLDEAAGGSLRYTQSTRRFSELPPSHLSAMGVDKRRASALPGIVCSNTDLISILSNLSSSANELNQTNQPKANKSSPTRHADQKRTRMKHRSNSFDISVLIDQERAKEDTSANNPRQWFFKRHPPEKEKDDSDSKVVWDGKSGSIVDAEQLGSAIEVFLRKSETNLPDASKGAIPKTRNQNTSGWYSAKDDEDNLESCDTSLCTTFKDLFIK